MPRIHWQWTGERLNVQDFIEGNSRPSGGALPDGFDRRLLARRGADAVLRMMEAGFFHADPHQGKRVLPARTNRIAFIDFGMVGRLPRRAALRWRR